MAAVKARVNQASGCLGSGIPALLFIFFLLGIPTLVTVLVGFNNLILTALSMMGGVLLAIIISVVLYPRLTHATENRIAEVSLEGQKLKWRIRKEWHAIDLNQAYEAHLYSGRTGSEGTGALVELKGEHQTVSLFWRKAPRAVVLRQYPDEGSIPALEDHASRSRGRLDFDQNDHVQAAFLGSLLAVLWQTRKNDQSRQEE